MSRRSLARAAIALVTVACISGPALPAAAAAPAHEVEAELLALAADVRRDEAVAAKARREADALAARVAELREDVDRLEQEVAVGRATVVERVVDASVRLGALFRPDAASRRLAAAERQLAAQRSELRKVTPVLVRRTRRAEAAKAEAEASRKELAPLEAAVAEGIAALQADVAANPPAVAGPDLFAVLLAERHRRAEAEGSAQSAPEPLARPHAGVLTSPFGPRWGRSHNGIDLGGTSGEPIGAAAEGIVVVAGPQGGFGNMVIVDHGGGLATLYAHFTTVDVSVGQAVGAGTRLGTMGCTGLCTGPHLHFEVRLDGLPQDPAGFLDLG